AWVFLMLFVVSVAAGMLVLSLFGIDLVTALNLSVLALANASAGTGTVLESPLRYGDLSGGVQMALSFMMILGRLESLAFFALLNPVFWRG
ncbi:MAG: TrkH family potassium uptake protein, partial [Rubricella sp.]